MLRAGTFADRTIVHEACAVKIPEELPVEQACLLACGFSTGAGAALWTTPVREGASVAVIGCGGVGLAVVQGARLAGAERIVAVDVSAPKLDAAGACQSPIASRCSDSPTGSVPGSLTPMSVEVIPAAGPSVAAKVPS